MEWRVSNSLVGYQHAVRVMEDRVSAIRIGGMEELVWLLEHPPLYTAGTSAKTHDLLDAGGLKIYKSGRGGQYTYHGPGQRVAYAVLDLQDKYTITTTALYAGHCGGTDGVQACPEGSVSHGLCAYSFQVWGGDQSKGHDDADNSVADCLDLLGRKSQHQSHRAEGRLADPLYF